MKKSLWSLAAVVLLTAGSAFAATNNSPGNSLSANAYVNNGTTAATISVSVKDSLFNCGTLNYTANGTSTVVTQPAGSLCPLTGTAPTAELDITESAITPFYMTLTDSLLGTSSTNQVTMIGPGANANFTLDVAVQVGLVTGYQTGTYITPATTTPAIVMTPSFHAAFPNTAALQPSGSYTGSTVAYISF